MRSLRDARATINQGVSMRVAIPAESKSGLESPVSPHFGRCPAFIIVELEGELIKAVDEVDNPFYGNHSPGQVPAFIKSQGADVILVGGMGRRALAYFDQYSIEAVMSTGRSVRLALEGFLQGRVEEVEPCAPSLRHNHHQDEE